MQSPRTLPIVRAEGLLNLVLDFLFPLFCDILSMIIGARGVSLLFATGDTGVGDGDPDPATQTCFTNNGKNQTKFIPMFPATCPL